MTLTYTWHALVRMSERKISEKEVEEIVNHPAILKQGRDGALHAAGVWEGKRGKFLNVIFIKQNHHVVVITVYPSERVII